MHSCQLLLFTFVTSVRFFVDIIKSQLAKLILANLSNKVAITYKGTFAANHVMKAFYKILHEYGLLVKVQ